MDFIGKTVFITASECSCGNVKARSACNKVSEIRGVKATFTSDPDYDNDVRVKLEHESFGEQISWMNADLFMQLYNEQNRRPDAVPVAEIFTPQQEEVEQVELVYLSA